MGTCRRQGVDVQSNHVGGMDTDVRQKLDLDVDVLAESDNFAIEHRHALLLAGPR
jgi:hypothetical protein